MGKTKFIEPLPDIPEDMIQRIVALEEEAMLRRKRKMESMRRYRAKLKSRSEETG